jgi:hypothetical protein
MLNPLSVLKHPVLLSLYFISSLAHAQSFSSAATDGVAGAGRAAVEAGDVNYLNPAGLVHLKGRYIYATGSKDDLSLSLSESSREVVVPASLSYLQRKAKDSADQDVKWKDMRLSLADFIVEKLSMGITGTMSTVDYKTSSYNQTNGHLGLFYTPNDHFGLAYVFYNLFGGKDTVPEEVRDESQMAVGLNFIYKNFVRYRFDVLSAKNNNFGKPAYMMGIETLLNEWLVFRVGYKNDILASQELFTQGIGFRGPIFSVDYAHQGSVKGANFDRHSIDLSISF